MSEHPTDEIPFLEEAILNFNSSAKSSKSNFFSDSESCLFVIDVMHRVWNVISLFFDIPDEIEIQLSEIFDSDQSELQELLALLGVPTAPHESLES